MNKITIAGTISNPEFSHNTKTEEFESFFISCMRDSGAADVVRCIASNCITKGLKENDKIEALGQVRSRNYDGEDGKRHTEIYIFIEEILPYTKDKNYVEIDGFICKEPNYRETPLGRQICDLQVASNRKTSSRSDYIPCITWGRNAIRASYLSVSSHLNLKGRMQSRTYMKRLENGEFEERTAYEMSINEFSVIEDNKEDLGYENED